MSSLFSFLFTLSFEFLEISYFMLNYLQGNNQLVKISYKVNIYREYFFLTSYMPYFFFKYESIYKYSLTFKNEFSETKLNAEIILFFSPHCYCR